MFLRFWKLESNILLLPRPKWSGIQAGKALLKTAFQREKDLFITLSIVYIQISNTYLPEFLNILLYVEANPVWMCR